MGVGIVYVHAENNSVSDWWKCAFFCCNLQLVQTKINWSIHFL